MEEVPVRRAARKKQPSHKTVYLEARMAGFTTRGLMKHINNPKEAQALLRYEVICHIKTRLSQQMRLSESLREASSRPWPDENGYCYSYRTIETWWYDYKKGGFKSLQPKPSRDDAGQSRTIDKDTEAWIIEQIIKNPKIALRVQYRLWQQEGRNLPSLSSVFRLLKTRGYDRRTLKAGRLETGPQKAFEAPSPNELWMTDFACGPTLKLRDGSVMKTHLCAFIDDNSRLITYAAYYEKADTASFHHCLKEAVLRRGLPSKLYTDNGKPFVSGHTRIVCANLAIRLIHAKPYHCWSKGKIERFFLTTQTDFEATLRLEGREVRSLEELNQAFSKWLSEVYHLRPHSSTNVSPHERFVKAHTAIRRVEEPDSIDLLFYTRVKRKVRRDGTIQLNAKCFEVDLSLRGLDVELHFDPIDMARIEVWYQDTYKGVARKLDRHFNAQNFNPRSNYDR